MPALLLTLLVIALVFAVLVVFGGRFIVNRVGVALNRRHGETEWILNTGIAPPQWHKRYSSMLRFIDRLGAGDGLKNRAKAFCKRRLERRLLGLLRYVEGSNVINDEAIRASMASTIRQVGKSWEESTWEQVTGEVDPDSGESPPEARPT